MLQQGGQTHATCWAQQCCDMLRWRVTIVWLGLKRSSHGKLKLANSCWQTQVGVCERRKNSRQTRWQTVGDK